MDCIREEAKDQGEMSSTFTLEENDYFALWIPGIGSTFAIQSFQRTSSAGSCLPSINRSMTPESVSFPQITPEVPCAAKLGTPKTPFDIARSVVSLNRSFISWVGSRGVDGSNFPAFTPSSINLEHSPRESSYLPMFSFPNAAS